MAIPFTVVDDSRAPAGSKRIILTFDDGPAEGVTAPLLDVLATHRVPAVFFFVGRRVEAFPELARRAAAEGHQIGAHSVDNAWPVWFDADALRRDVAEFRAIVESVVGTPMADPTLYRPPRGILTPAVRALVAACEIQLGYLTFYARDSGAGRDAAETVLARTRSALLEHEGGALVLHTSRYRGDSDLDDSVDKTWVPQAVAELIEWAREQGFEFTRFPAGPDAPCSQ